MNNDIGTLIDGTAQIGASYGAINHQWNAIAVRYIGKDLKVDDITGWVAYGFTENGFGILIS
jgi:hypothetical protein